MCLFNFHPQPTKLGVSWTCSKHYPQMVFWKLVLCMYSASSSCGVEAADNQSHTSWQNNMSYIGPLTPVDLPSYWDRFYFWSKSWESSIIPLLLVKNMKMLTFPSQKCCVSHPVTIWTVRDMLIEIPLVATNFARSISLITGLIPNCLNKGTLIL